MSNPKGQSIETETASSTESAFEGGSYGLRSHEGPLGDVARGTWRFFHEIPAVGGAVLGGVGIAVSMAIGAGDLVIGLFAAYIGYRIFAYGESYTDAVEKTFRLEKGILGEEERMRPVRK